MVAPIRAHQCLSAWQAHESTTRRTAVADHGLHPVNRSGAQAHSCQAALGVEPPDAPLKLSAPLSQKTLTFWCFVLNGQKSHFKLSKCFKSPSLPRCTGQLVHVSL